ncbi:MAG TPA: PqqD family protein [Candidatus Acidoferrales bacterium]|nr:PqqD family protein [Candidatus Acidoferrales bacterium]
MSRKRYVARSVDVAARVLGDEAMILSARDSTLFILDEVATSIWEAADGVTALDRIIAERVCSQFDVAPETALKDAEIFVEQLGAHGILTVSDTPIDVPDSSAAKGAP